MTIFLKFFRDDYIRCQEKKLGWLLCLVVNVVRFSWWRFFLLFFCFFLTENCLFILNAFGTVHCAVGISLIQKCWGDIWQVKLFKNLNFWEKIFETSTFIELYKNFKNLWWYNNFYWNLLKVKENLIKFFNEKIIEFVKR